MCYTTGRAAAACRVAGVVFLVLVACGLGFSASAQDALLRAKERAKFLGDFKALLEDGDPLLRTAAMQEALAGDDPDLRSMALETALSSGDERLQTAALRAYVDGRKQILVTFVMPDRPSEVQAYLFEKWNGLRLEDPKVVPASDEIEFKQYYGVAGQLVRGGMEFRFEGGSYGKCRMTVRPATGTVLAGQFHCTFPNPATAHGKQASVPVRIDLS